MIVFLYILSTFQFFLSLLSVKGGRAFLAHFQAEFDKPQIDFTPIVSIFLPCKGIEEGLKENISALFDQDHPNFEVIFIVDDNHDPAVSVINEFLELHQNSSLVIAQLSTESGQKVENLREGVLHASPNSEVFVFVDSDARPSRSWLRYLIAPLKNENIGAATGYRWFITAEGKFNLSSELKSLWNASVTSVLGSDTSKNFCWGGSTAIRRIIFERLEIREKWLGTLSDDFTLTHVLKKAGLPIYFVPQALTATFDNSNFSELIEFTNRQIKITRVYSAGHWIYSFIGSALFCIVTLWALFILLFGFADSYEFLFACFTLIFLFSTGVLKAHFRFKAVLMAFPQHKRLLLKQRPFQLLLWPAASFIFLYNCISASFSRQIKWRGTTYEMVSSKQTNTISTRR